MSFSCVRIVNRAAIYQGDIVITPRLDSLCALVNEVRGLLESVWTEPLSAFVAPEFVSRFFELRQALEENEALAAKLAKVVEELQEEPKDFCYDPPRLRYLYPGLEAVEAAAPVFYAHRDTWYGNSASQINVWTPLFPVTDDQVFSFFPDFFEKPVVNDSAEFVAEEFVGFGRPPAAPGNFPRALRSLSGGTRYRVEPGEALLFSAAHLHRSNPVKKPRISLDFRLVHRADHQAGLGAPDPDNASRSVGLKGYRRWP